MTPLPTIIGAARGVLPPGTQLSGVYEIDELIATGGMGEVYRGHIIDTGDKVAIKLIRWEFATDTTFVALFRKEASSLYKLQHEAIIRYYISATDPVLRRPYLAMELIEGESLTQTMRRAPLSVPDVLTMMERLASGMAVAHDFGIVHRDIAPDNVYLPNGDPSKAKIIDFGIARNAFGGDSVIGASFAGKLNFVSPEQVGLFEGEVSGKSDIYSLGLTLAAAAAGSAIDMGGTHVSMVQKRQVVPDLSALDPRLRLVLAPMLQPHPKDRPASMRDVVALARGLVETRAVAAAPSPEKPRSKSLALKVAAGVATVAVLLGAGAYERLGPRNDTRTAASTPVEALRPAPQVASRPQGAASPPSEAQADRQTGPAPPSAVPAPPTVPLPAAEAAAPVLPPTPPEPPAAKVAEARAPAPSGAEGASGRTSESPGAADDRRTETAPAPSVSGAGSTPVLAEASPPPAASAPEPPVKAGTAPADALTRGVPFDAPSRPLVETQPPASPAPNAPSAVSPARSTDAAGAPPSGEMADPARATAIAGAGPQPISTPPAAASVAMAAVPVAAASLTRGATFQDCPTCPQLTVVGPGTFRMGSNADSTERPIHKVAMKGFAMGIAPVTVAEWERCVADKACHYELGGDPASIAHNLSFDDAIDYVAWLSHKTGHTYRLPSEAEWEFAARAGTTTRYWWGDHFRADLSPCLGCGAPSDVAPEPRRFQPNPFGLLAVTGAVSQWTADCWHKTYARSPADGSAWLSPTCHERVLRGGAWNSSADALRVTNRDFYDPKVRYPGHGFRVARDL
ncbi:MAG TPA: SUMF1/EgtB/PvdO family nonheme iron enzyme [Lichenihabitans sp.]|jgi:formylglycine-generating enzyme required for sulfatase activity|nr:SUMF1/EgtB/PvdO family nonheme iron enzyme [Lichenihabitans sp.]